MEWQTTSSVCHCEPHSLNEKAKVYDTVTGEEWINSSRGNKEIEPKQKLYPVVDVCLMVKVKSNPVKNNIA